MMNSYIAPQNLRQVLDRGERDTFPLHTALWLHKNYGCSETLAFNHLPGPRIYGNRFSSDDFLSRIMPFYDRGGASFEATAWLLCFHAMSGGVHVAGPGSGFYGANDNALESTPSNENMWPSHQLSLVKRALEKIKWPLHGPPTFDPDLWCAYSILVARVFQTIFRPFCQMLLVERSFRLGKIRMKDPAHIIWNFLQAADEPYAPSTLSKSDIEKVVGIAARYAERAIRLPTKSEWEFERGRSWNTNPNIRRGPWPQGTYSEENVPVKCKDGNTVHMLRHRQCVPLPFLGLPIFNPEALLDEAKRLLKLCRLVEGPPMLLFMANEDWEIIKRVKSTWKGHPTVAAWNWIEHIYGQRVHYCLQPSGLSKRKRMPTEEESGH